MKLQRTLPFVLLSGALLLGACNSPVNTTPTPETGGVPVDSVLGKGTATLSADVVRSNRGTAVEGSTVYLYRTGQRSTAVGKATTNAQGYVEFAKIPEGTYDLVFLKSKSAGSEFDGAVAKAGINTRVKVAQFASADPNATADVPQLKLELPATLDANGEVSSWKELSPGTAFNDTVDVRAYTVKNSDTPRVMRYFLFSLVTIDAQGNWADVRPGTGLYEQDPGYVTPGVDPNGAGQDSGLVSLDPTGLKGDVYLQVVGLDFNYNRVAYLVPITVNRTAASTVVAPANVRAVAYTLSERIDYLYGTRTPDAPTSGTNLWVTTSWDAPVDLGGYTGFRVLRATSAAGPYTQVAFAGSKQCAAPADAKATTRRCTVSDNTATLITDQDYFYKVVAVGSNEAASADPAMPSTHTLPQFHPQLLSPAKDVHGVELTPTYTLKMNLFSMGATGAQMDLRVADFVTGESYAYAARRLVLRKGFDAGGTPETQILSNLQGSNLYYVFRGSWATDNDPKTENDTVTYDPASDVLSVPHQFENGLLGSSVIPLQANRRYSWFLNKAYAYRLMDPSKPASAANYVAAYSVYSDPDTAALIVPGGVRQQAAEVNDFTTRE
ncbi:carboxypeptidase-like regulatory domain-containing protein [Deinococcus hopiensis]|uniref:Carboxypeptidase regulatory-like domain-containing protein n=1 Tax=Deinococcus hopiensis KR-140 TaxID=695939 RepID=A0A1W1VSB7_9DEIO|nr:carboxypeptidase-like regulatory domain-containing protein [Deinococcus hopiensis]SMB96173.1 hypothetical protein SAMN00790413_03181 [Deinococcus hopiensis KR-140]